MRIAINSRKNQHKFRPGKGHGLVANLFWRAVLLQGLRLCGGAVLVRPADVNSVVAPKPAIPSEHVRAQNTFNLVAGKTQMIQHHHTWYTHRRKSPQKTETERDGGAERERERRVTADDVAEMGDVVDVREGARDEDVPSAGDGELRWRPRLPVSGDLPRIVSHPTPTATSPAPIRDPLNGRREEEGRAAAGGAATWDASTLPLPTTATAAAAAAWLSTAATRRACKNPSGPHGQPLPIRWCALGKMGRP